MNRVLCILIILVCSSFIYGQNSDSTIKNIFPRHYISINPINSIALDQIGLSYEYKFGVLGLGVTVGYKYAGGQNYCRFFIAGTTQLGSFEFYKGFFVNPQENFYFSKPKCKTKYTLPYLSLKCVYKYLHLDSNQWHIFGGTGDDPIYRKQIDNANIIGSYIVFGVKHISKHFFYDFNIGPGWIFIDQSMIVAGESEYHIYPYNQHPPYHEYRSRNHFSFNINLNFGYTFLKSRK